MAETTLIIGSKNYSSWSLRGWLLTRMSGLPFQERSLDVNDPGSKEELLLRSSSILVPCLIHQEVPVWDTLAIAEYLNEMCPEARMLPDDRVARARCRSVSGEMHSGFTALRSSLPMNLRSRRKDFKIWASAQADIERIDTIWRDCLATWGGPFLFGDRFTVADAMYAPVCTRFQTYDVPLGEPCAAYSARILGLPDMVAWTQAALAEEGQVAELDVEF